MPSITYGDSHRAGSAPLSEHMKKASGSGAVRANSNVADWFSLETSGPELIIVIGGLTKPISHSYSAHWSSQIPSGSLARTANSCPPSVRPVYVFGELQFSSSTPSSQHQYVEPGVDAAKVNVALLLSVTSSGAGPERMVVTGGDATRHVQVSGVGSQLPQASRARTSSVCTPRVRSEYSSGEVHELYCVP